MTLFNIKNFKFSFLFVTAIMGLFFCAQNVWAHPLDITATEIHVSSGSKQIEAQTYIHPFLVGMLLKKNNISYDSINDYYEHKEVIVEYLNSRLTFKDDNSACRISSMNFPPMDEFEMMGGGFEVDYTLDCKKKVSS
jgi:hypothetical protein